MRRSALTALLLLPALSFPAWAQTTTQPTTAPKTAAPATVTPAPATDGKTIEAVTATSPRGFSIRMPGGQGWTPLKNVPNTDVAFLNQTVNGLRPTVTVITQDVDPKIKATLADFRDLFSRQLGKDVPSYKLLGEKTTRVSGMPAILWTYSGDGDGGPVRWTQVITLKSNRLFTVTLMTPTGTPADVIDTGREILDSFALTLK
ncbi:molybdate transport system ATP-binding protein [Deinococcus metalli]|uniref:Molybdate transport system ATP-binding protein n=1 Tax=Deinococcus metalli TaxID=1141878 RepID=A0A7W8KHH6_9DEIO|nr:hypothetical protein [Deinococcus metalli]MBB5377101.1 molybdate transport system ATP-binding protein [Deinococcus metalli]